MDAKRKLGSRALAGIEGEMRVGDFSHMYIYVREALENYAHDSVELLRRRDIIAARRELFEDAYAYAAILSAVAGDKKGWSENVEAGDRKIPISLGYVAHAYLPISIRSKNKDDESYYLFEDSAKRGHIHSKIIVAERNFSFLGSIGSKIIYPYKLFLGFQAFVLFKKDSKDDRLPKGIQIMADR